MVTIKIRTETVAFKDADELARIFRNLAHKCEYGNMSDVLRDISGMEIRDINGNVVGNVTVTK